MSRIQLSVVGIEVTNAKNSTIVYPHNHTLKPCPLCMSNGMGGIDAPILAKLSEPMRILFMLTNILDPCPQQPLCKQCQGYGYDLAGSKTLYQLREEGRDEDLSPWRARKMGMSP